MKKLLFQNSVLAILIAFLLNHKEVTITFTFGELAEYAGYVMLATVAIYIVKYVTAPRIGNVNGFAISQKEASYEVS